MATNLRKLFTNRLSNRTKARLIHKRARARFVLNRLFRRARAKYSVASKIAPIFVIGTNRSGTSLCTLILSKHPDIEGIFRSSEPGHRITDDGHSSSGAEANHIWQGLDSPDYDLTVGESVLWGLPESISKLYAGSVAADEKLQLVDELLSARATGKIPLVLNSRNVLRIRLIKELFPKARFVFMTRDHKSFIKSGKHKWTKDREIGALGPSGYIDYPHIGLHWLLINSIALYDLRKYAAADYIHVKLRDLHGEESLRTETINRVFDFLGLDPMESPDDVFDDGFIFSRSENAEEEIDVLDELINHLFEYEKGLD